MSVLEAVMSGVALSVNLALAALMLVASVWTLVGENVSRVVVARDAVTFRNAMRRYAVGWDAVVEVRREACLRLVLTSGEVVGVRSTRSLTISGIRGHGTRIERTGRLFEALNRRSEPCGEGAWRSSWSTAGLAEVGLLVVVPLALGVAGAW